MIQYGLFWVTLAASFVVFWLLPVRFRLAFLAVASFAFLATLDVFSTLTLLLGSCAIKLVWDFNGKHNKALISLKWLVVLLLIWLCAFKALPNLISTLFEGSEIVWLVLPLGISYYVFKLIHYSIERSRGNFTEPGFDEYFCWLYLFPIFSAGPIEPLEHFIRERSKIFDGRLIIEGLSRIVHGLIKKLVLADWLVRETLMNGHTVASAMGKLDAWPFWQVWVFFGLLYLFFYLEFSAYSDIAIGASRLFGLRIVENFNWPIIATSISDFWKRWHMSLAAFCQRYVYMPVMARSRNPYVAVYCTFIAMGLWHAVDLNFLCWGLYHATGVSIALSFARFKRQRGWPLAPSGVLKYRGIPITFIFVSVSGVFGGTSGLGIGATGQFLAAMVGL